MTDTVNVPREWLENMPEPHDYLSNQQQKSAKPFVDAMRKWNSERRAMLADAPKAEPVSDPYKLEAQWIKHFRAHPEAPKVEQEPVAITEDWRNRNLFDGFYFAKVRGFNGAGMTILRRKQGKWFHANTPSIEPIAVSAQPITGHHPAPASDDMELRGYEYRSGRAEEHWKFSRDTPVDHFGVLEMVPLYRLAKHKGPQS